MQAAIGAIAYHLPARMLSNDDLAREFPNWSSEKILSKTGIRHRHLTQETEYASDLAVAAAEKLLAKGACTTQNIDFVVLCTQSPDYLLPATACLVQQRLGLPTTVGAMDVNLGCSGYVYGLSVAKGLIETGQVRNVLLLTCETYSKFMDPSDFNVRALFGDGASATLLQPQRDPPASDKHWIGPFVFGTDGQGRENLILRRGGTRDLEARRGAGDSAALFMNGPEIFSFTLKAVPDVVERLLTKAGATMDDIDLFVFHQANAFVLEHLRKKLRIPAEKFVYALEDCGNTTSSSIPIAMCQELAGGRIRHGNTVMLVSFGVGYSWAATLLQWRRPGTMNQKE